jgi:hypothetical protein
VTGHDERRNGEAMAVERSVTKVVEGEPLAATVNDEFSGPW